MKAREVISVVMGEMCAEAIRTTTPNIDDIEATIRKVVNLLDTLPDSINVETHVEITFDVTQAS